MFETENRRIRILIVDNDNINVEAGQGVLEGEGYDIYTASSGETAIELVCSINFDMVLIDIALPGMNGFETLKILKQNEHSKDIPVIFLTEKLDVENMVKGFMYGAVDYIRKPFVELELKARVKNHVQMKKLKEELERKNTDLKEAYNLLELVNTTDPLTNLYNRKEIMNRIEAEMIRYERYKRRFSVVVADIDDFEIINDNYGRRFGDFIIMSVAEILQDGIRKQDSASRLDGNRFLVVLPETDKEGAVTFAEKARSRIEEHVFEKNNIKTKISMTFGTATYNEEQEVYEFVDKADKALIKGKQKGRNCVVSAE